MAIPMTSPGRLQCMPAGHRRSFKHAFLPAYPQGILNQNSISCKSNFCRLCYQSLPSFRCALNQDFQGGPLDNRQQEPERLQPEQLSTSQHPDLHFILPLLGVAYGVWHHTSAIPSVLSWLAQLFDASKVSLGDVIALCSVVLPIGVKFWEWLVGRWAGFTRRVSYIDCIPGLVRDVNLLKRKVCFLPPYNLD